MPAARTQGAKRQDDDKVVIKKYANRRLYDTARSSYVTLEDLSRMIRAGEDFAVFDAKTGEDITHSVLTQIIFEEEQKGRNLLPTNFLRQIIRLYGDALQGIVPSYLDASMEAFSKNQEQMREAFRANPALANFEAMTRQNIEIFERAMRMFNPFAPGAPGAPGGHGGYGGHGGQGGPATQDAPGAAPDRPEPQGGGERRGAPRQGMTDDLDRLQRQLREMQSQLEALSKSRG